MWLMKFAWFRKIAFKLLIPKKKPKKFPEWIIKTDETRLQNMPFVLDAYKGKPMVVTEKLDGTSTSFGLRKEKKIRVRRLFPQYKTSRYKSKMLLRRQRVSRNGN